jgi:hypothetical protein
MFVLCVVSKDKKANVRKQGKETGTDKIQSTRE